MDYKVYQQEYDFLWSEIEKKSDVFRHKASSAVMSLTNGILDDLVNGNEGRFALAGEEGCGKTLCFAYICDELKRKGYTVLPVMCRTTVCGRTPIEIMKNLVWQMEVAAGAEHALDYDALGEIAVYKDATYVMGKNHRMMAALQNRFAELCAKYTAEKEQHLIVAVDALDLCFQGRTWEETEFIPHLITKHIRVFATCDQYCVSPEDAVRKSIPEFSGGKVDAEWKQIKKKGLKAYLKKNESVADGELLQAVCEALAVAARPLSYKEISGMLALVGTKADEEQIRSTIESATELFAVCAKGCACNAAASDAKACVVIAHSSITEGILATCGDIAQRYASFAEYNKDVALASVDAMRGVTAALIKADKKQELLALLLAVSGSEKKQLWYTVAMEVFEHIFAEGNKWIAALTDDLLAGEYSEEDKLKVLNFMAFQVWDCFVGIPKEALYKKRLAEVLIAAVEKILAQKDSVPVNVLCGMLYDYMGQILYRANGQERPENALKWYEKEAEVYEHMLREYGPVHMGSLRAAFDKIEKINILRGEAQYREKALYYLQKEVALSEKVWNFTKSREDFLALSVSLEKLCDFLAEEGGKENLEQALFCAMRSLSIRAVLSQGLKAPLESLPVSYARIAEVHYRLGGAENIKKALEFRETEVKLWKRLAKNKRTEKILQNLSSAYNSLGGLYLEQGGPANLEKAQKNFEESFKVMEELLQMTGTVGSLRNLYVGYYKLGDVYAYYGERDTLVAARFYFGKAQEICERLNSELKTQESKNDLNFIKQQLKALQSKLDSYGKKGRTLAEKAKDEGVSIVSLREQYRKAGEAYEDKGDKENLLLAIEQYKAELSLLQSESAEEGTTEKRLEVAEAYLRIGNAHEQIDERDELHNALRNYSTALQFFYQLDQESTGIRTQRALATAYIYKSNCCEKLGSREDTWIAREGYLQAKAIREKIYDKLHDEQSRKEMVYCERQLERLEQLIKDSVPTTPAD